MVSFDVVSLFAAIPVERACEHIRNKLTNDKNTEPNSRLKTLLIFYVLRFLTDFLITSHKPENKSTVVQWAVL